MQVPAHSSTSANKSRTAPRPTPQHSILDSTPIHFALTFFGRISVSLCLYLFACMSLNYVATMYKRLVCISQINYLVVFPSSVCCLVPSSLCSPRSARLALSSSSLISRFCPCCSPHTRRLLLAPSRRPNPLVEADFWTLWPANELARPY